MAVGCRHDPEYACDDCIKELAGGNAAFFATDLKPEMGESLASFQARVEADRTIRATGGTPQDRPPAAPGTYIEPSLEEQKRIIRDPSVPEPIRRFWREKLYGKGGTVRKGIQQERAQKMMESLNSNFQDRTLNALVDTFGNPRPDSVFKHLPGKRRKKARRLLRQLAKTAKNAA
jgi:hypothetical protein